MVKVRIHGPDTRKDADGVAIVTYSEALNIVAAGAGAIVGDDGAAAGQAAAAPAADQAPAAETEPEPDPLPDLDGMTRAELDQVARGRGLTPSRYRTKADVIAALRG